MKSLRDLNVYSTSSVAFTDQTLGAGQVLPNRYQINGLLDTGKPVLENIEKICSAAASWLSYDSHEGKWGVVINQSSTSVVSFNDSNIIGNISVSGTGLQDLYNSVKVEFPHRELRDSADFISVEIPDGDRNANEEDNALNISYDIINDPVQANLLGFIELKQSRVDLVIRFVTDFSYINLKAGDVVAVTDSRFSFTNKKFRIIAITEIQEDDGALMMEITALEYSDSVYDTSDLYKYTRTDENGIITIGSIGVPGTPQVTKYEIDSRPRIIIETTVPSGVVDGMEFWLSTDTALPENQRSYVLIGVKRPDPGGVYSSGDEVDLDYDNVSSSTFAIKTRGFNATTVGPFSDPSGLIAFTSTQVTQAIGPDTGVIDALGNLGTILGAYTLLKGVDELYQKIANTGSLFTKIFEAFEDLTGVDLIGDAEAGTLGGLGVAKDGTLITNSATSLNFVGDAVELVDNGGGNISIEIATTASGVRGYTGSKGDIGYTGSAGAQGPIGYVGSSIAQNNNNQIVLQGEAAKYFGLGTRLPPDRATYLDPITGATSDTASLSGMYYIAFTSNGNTMPDYYNLTKNSGRNVYLYKSDGTLVETISSDNILVSQVSSTINTAYGGALPPDVLSIAIPFAPREYGTDYYILMDEGILTYCNSITTLGITDPDTWNFNTPPYVVNTYTSYPSPSLTNATFSISPTLVYPTGNIGCNSTVTDIIIDFDSSRTSNFAFANSLNSNIAAVSIGSTSTLSLTMTQLDATRFRIKNARLPPTAGTYNITISSFLIYKLTPYDCGISLDTVTGVTGISLTIPASSGAISLVTYNLTTNTNIDSGYIGSSPYGVVDSFIEPQTNIGLVFNKRVAPGDVGLITIYNSSGAVFQQFDVSKTFTNNKISNLVINSTTTNTTILINPTTDFQTGESYYLTAELGSIKDICGTGWSGIASTSTISWSVDPGPKTWYLTIITNTYNFYWDRNVIGSTGTVTFTLGGNSYNFAGTDTKFTFVSSTPSEPSSNVTIMQFDRTTLGIPAGNYSVTFNPNFVNEGNYGVSKLPNPTQTRYPTTNGLIGITVP